MTDPESTNPREDQLPNVAPEGDVPVDELVDDLFEEEAPRRAASAEFEVRAQIGSHAALRDAMDPANQSLGEALRLSFRVLQAVILVLVVLFLASGFETVEDKQSGALTVWGKIVPYEEVGEELEKGLKFSWWPYPAGQFVLVDVQNRSVSVAEIFWPHIPEGRTMEEAMEAARATSQLAPGIDGSLLTSEGDLSHLQFTAQYEIDDAVAYLSRINDEQADRFVQLALQRAAVHVTGETTLRNVVDATSDLASRIKANAQEKLDAMSCGIRITRVDVLDAKPPFAIARTYQEVQAVRVEADAAIERAKLNADSLLTQTIGQDYRDLIDLIDRYEVAVDLDEEAQSEELLDQINGYLESDKAGGTVSDIIQMAKSYQAQIDSTLGAEARRFNGLYEVYRQNPQLVIRQQWLETYRNVLAREDIETWQVPEGIRTVAMRLRSIDELQELRRGNRLDFKEQEALRKELESRGGLFIPHKRDIEGSARQRQLRIEGDRVVGGGSAP
ncbi:MAG: hypothetical protein JSV91_15290 [Phycisphaerales bacterium]|nr:MAG: hypothetical protein JSV91_15290 [Phycisphaerales bacterium]